MGNSWSEGADDQPDSNSNSSGSTQSPSNIGFQTPQGQTSFWFPTPNDNVQQQPVTTAPVSIGFAPQPSVLQHPNNSSGMAYSSTSNTCIMSPSQYHTPSNVSTPIQHTSFASTPGYTGQCTQSVHTPLSNTAQTPHVHGNQSFNNPLDLTRTNTLYMNDNTCRKQIEPRTFDGDECDVHDYFLHFETVCQWNNFNEPEMAQLLIMKLTGEAQKTVANVQPQYLFNYQHLKALLIQRFSPRQLELAYRCEFRKRRRNETESIADYGQSLRRLAQKAYPTLCPDSVEICLIDKFIAGLKHFDMQRHIQFKHPKTFDEAISLGIEYEALMGMQQNTPNKYDPQMAPQNESRAYTEINRLSKQVEWLTHELKKSRNTNHVQFDPRYAQGTREHADDINYHQNSAYQGYNRKREIICNYCNRPGHVESRCFDKQRNQQQQNLN